MMKRLFLWLTALSLCVPDAHADLEPRPKVRLEVKIESQRIRERLKEEADPFSIKLRDRILEILDAEFPYLEWVTSGSDDRVLSVTLKQRQGTVDQEYILEYGSSAVSGPPIVRQLYGSLSPPPRDAKPLKEALLGETKEKPGTILTDVLHARPALRAYFASRVPLVKRVDVSKKHVALPVLGVDPEYAKFLVTFADTATKRGRIQLFEPLQDPERGVVCRISNFNYLGEPEINAEWDEAIPTVMTEKVDKKSVNVTVVEFISRANSGTYDGSVTELPTGGQR